MLPSKSSGCAPISAGPTFNADDVLGLLVPALRRQVAVRVYVAQPHLLGPVTRLKVGECLGGGVGGVRLRRLRAQRDRSPRAETSGLTTIGGPLCGGGVNCVSSRISGLRARKPLTDPPPALAAAAVPVAAPAGPATARWTPSPPPHAADALAPRLVHRRLGMPAPDVRHVHRQLARQAAPRCLVRPAGPSARSCPMKP